MGYRVYLGWKDLKNYVDVNVRSKEGAIKKAIKKVKKEWRDFRIVGPLPEPEIIGVPEVLSVKREKDNDEEVRDISRALLEDNKSLLPGGKVKWYKFKNPDYRILKTFENPGKSEYVITFETEEISALCPLTGFPDNYHLILHYVPGKKCIESKSAKFYFGSFRDYGAFIEALANRILDDWVLACGPEWIKVDLTMNVRGGIAMTVVKEYGMKR